MDENEVLKESEPMYLAAAMQPIIEQLKCDKKFPAVHTYTSTLHSFLKFAACNETTSEEVSPPTIQEVFQPGTLKEYETWLRGRQSSWNTVSTYQRTLKAVYNRLLQKEVTVEHGFVNSVTGDAFGDGDDEVTLPDN